MALNEKQSEVIDLLILGNLSKTRIAKSVGIAEKTVYNWLNDNEEFKAELQRRTEVFNNTRIVEAKNKLSVHLQNAINNIVEMAEDKDNPKRFECNKYLVDRVLGNTTTKLEQTTENKNNNNTKVDIKSMISEIELDNDKDNIIELDVKKAK
ncbi:hypothetical protein HYH38_08340 [Clostridium botulinum]|uniref:phBC6A51 family helix-turn-helix protein n=1 Tax=Clostridium botulinum TaxID=1491 RepID=UPI001967DBF7|nr:phBC6A51 family helix-turn-helix protein [Clostridium botulinum]MBN1071522.1 hypothetical protein [Clostridium botulinum]MBY6816457.1 hypothetical protein [Clostridium botulinum]MBY6827288.1 hypothetical protein [Clostridium botulinum]MBY6859236.1 hypothetical protein [Clostridium botulinum]MBY7041480.1 hypothetical protein [Clostridium botulinum]